MSAKKGKEEKEQRQQNEAHRFREWDPARLIMRKYDAAETALTFVFWLLVSGLCAPSVSDLVAWQIQSQWALPPAPSHSFLPMPEKSRTHLLTFLQMSFGSTTTRVDGIQAEEFKYMTTLQ